MDKIGFNKKGLLVIALIVVVALGFLAPKIIAYIEEAKNSGDGTIAKGKFNALLVDSNLKSNKITLFDSYDKVIEVLGKPISVSDSQIMISLPQEEFNDCQFLLYENFFVIIKNTGVAGWYLNPDIKDNKYASFYLPTLTSGESKTFLDFYKSWEGFSSDTYSNNFAELKKFNFGKIYFCMFYIDVVSAKENLTFYSENELYRMRQKYSFESGNLIMKSVEMIDENLVKNSDNYSTMFLGRTEDYIKKYFADATIKRDKEDIDAHGKKIKILSLLKKDQTLYRFVFEPKTLKCLNITVQPNFK